VPETYQAVIDRALDAYGDLAALGETIEDEWSYVNDLVDGWRDRLTEVSDDRGASPAPPETGAAIDRAIVEIETIADPHRAIDWLSTFPQVVLLACGLSP
jgi:hypothetical protein